MLVDPYNGPLPRESLSLVDSSTEPSCLFVIPGSCDFVVWCLLIHQKNTPRKNTNTKPSTRSRAGRRWRGRSRPWSHPQDGNIQTEAWSRPEDFPHGHHL